MLDSIDTAQDLVDQAPKRHLLYDQKLVLKMAEECLQRYIDTYAYRDEHLYGDEYDCLEPIM